ncbi:M23 family metallopeptidase [Erythrobacter sp. A6_0]|jgi:murein DD-endopeptidase MepM/ murein hydrolase activator NlpD|uniref:M23 family metallopeptidase n=1 Tax=Erythrobacter sp. A6_0 TaxID=2821089 RepID=UPI001ADC49BB|nr:M23 family metallopeptidase [Erythrobacter sp. A6_0]MBO9511798.1 M23 family metallopeptidase [Erythrobacter sp. A6_0]
MTKLFNNALRTLALGLGAVTMMAAAPAAAESAASAAMVPAVDMPAGNSAGAPVTTSDGDRQFEQLFASWERMDKVSAGVATTSVSVPSAMPLTDARLSSGYGMRNHPVLGGRRGHKGVDLAAPTGTPVYATADGFVSKADWFSSYGKYISIEHGASLQTRFAHLSDMVVSAGDKVKKGDLIGYVGSTGRSTGPHLHYEVRVDGVAVDPSPYMVPSDDHRDHALALLSAE